MNKLNLIPIWEPDRMGDEMLAFITAGASPNPDSCQLNNCKINTGKCSIDNMCEQNYCDCGHNICQNNTVGPKPPCPQDCTTNFAPPPCQGVTNY